MDHVDEREGGKKIEGDRRRRVTRAFPFNTRARVLHRARSLPISPLWPPMWDVAPAEQLYVVVCRSCFNAKCVCPNASTISATIQQVLAPSGLVARCTLRAASSAIPRALEPYSLYLFASRACSNSFRPKSARVLVRADVRIVEEGPACPDGHADESNRHRSSPPPPSSLPLPSF